MAITNRKISLIAQEGQRYGIGQWRFENSYSKYVQGFQGKHELNEGTNGESQKRNVNYKKDRSDS